MLIRSQGGFSLVELLVAVLVMGIGVLGVTGLQLVSLQNNRDALLRGEALQYANEILDRARANRNGNYATTFADGPGAPGDCVANACNAAAMAAYDLAIWKCSLGGHNEDGICTNLRDTNVIPDEDMQPGLPEGAGEVLVAGNTFTVSVRWEGFNQVDQTVTITSERL